MAEAYVTRDELAGELRGLREEMAGMRRDLRDGMAAMRTELRDEMAAMRTELRDEIAAVRREFREEIVQLRADLNQLRSDLISAVAALDLRIDGVERRMNAFIVVFGTAMFLMFLTELLILRKVGL